MKAWFEIKPLQKKVGIITDIYLDYYELKCIESGNYYIKHKSLVEIIS